jgi:hypothetical protein
MEKEKPEIELYMYSLNQEFPVDKGHSTFLKRNTETYKDVTGKLVGVEHVASQTYNLKGDSNWSAQWISNEWIENHTKLAGEGLQYQGDPLDNITMRQEDFGGILFDRINDRVYKVNVPGYKLFQKILETHKKRKLGEFRSKDFEPKDIEYFVGFLKGAGLWST